MNSFISLAEGRGRCHDIDLMKFLAAILITNSHMVSLYPSKYSLLATGGAIGDSLFFFCSGFCLMIGSNIDFFNWYKRRINRIFPTIFAVVLVEILIGRADPTFKNVIVNGGGWFVRAILVFYVFFWFVKHFFSNKLWVAFVIDAVIILVWFICVWDKDLFILADATYLRWPCFFMVMLTGAFVSQNVSRTDGKEVSGKFYTCLLVVLLLFYYGYQLLWNRFPYLKDFQVVLLLALIGIVYVLYKLCSNKKVLTLYQNKYLYWAMYGISACCLEIYLSGGWSFDVGRSLIHLFPLNIIITFLLIFVIAYLVKVFSNFLSQTFKTEHYNWKALIKL